WRAGPGGPRRARCQATCNSRRQQSHEPDMDPDQSAATLLTSGHDALRRLAWRDARAAFEAALALNESPEALEGLAQATTWLHDIVTLNYRERAFHAYRDRGDRAAAAR